RSRGVRGGLVVVDEAVVGPLAGFRSGVTAPRRAEGPGGRRRLRRRPTRPRAGGIAMSGGRAKGFLDDQVANIDGDVPRAVYADWLEENGRPERAEFVPVQVGLARLPALDAPPG